MIDIPLEVLGLVTARLAPITVPMYDNEIDGAASIAGFHELRKPGHAHGRVRRVGVRHTGTT